MIDDLPEGGQHPRRTIEFGPDGRLYLQIGSSCNSCMETDASMAAISVIDPEGWSRRVFAHGLRNLWVSTGTQRPGRCGRPITAATGSATRCRRMS